MTARYSAVAGLVVVALLGVFLLIRSDDDGPALVVYGHSYAAGHDEHDPWPELVAGALDRPLENHAVAGDVAAQTLHRIDGIPNADDIVVVQTGLNDALRGADPAAVAAFEADLRSIVDLVGSEGARVYVAVDADLAWSDADPPFHPGAPAALEAFRDAARRVGTAVIDLSVGWDPRRMLDTDRVHPNEAGIRALADTITTAITQP